MNEMIDLNVDKFISHLSNVINPLGTEVIKFQWPIQKDIHGNKYYCKSKREFYKFCTEYDENEVMELMSQAVKRDIESRLMYGDEDTKKTRMMGVYNIHLQRESSENYDRTDESAKYIYWVWIRYIFGTIDMKDIIHITDGD